MAAADGYARVEVASVAELRAWFEANHERDEGIWLVTWKKSEGARYVGREDVLDACIAFGWIDGARRKHDDPARTMQLLTPRRAQHWAQTYKDRAARLEAEGSMHEAGRAAVARSKREGLWDFMADVDALVVPDDLAAAFATRPGSRDRFEAFGASSQRFALRVVKLAKTQSTRAKRVEEIARLAERGEKLPGS